jgi:hypothetical protein
VLLDLLSTRAKYSCSFISRKALRLIPNSLALFAKSMLIERFNAFFFIRIQCAFTLYNPFILPFTRYET